MHDTERTRWFYATPGRFVITMLVVEALLRLSERFDWLGWHKGYAVLIGVASAGIGLMFLLFWFAVALVFRWRFQFSIRSLMLVVVTAALPCSWLAVDMQAAKRQKDVVEALQTFGGVGFDWQYDTDGYPRAGFGAPAIECLRKLLSDEFFADVRIVSLDKQTSGAGVEAVLDRLKDLKELRVLGLSGAHITDKWLVHLEGVRQIEHLWIYRTRITDAGLEYLTGLTRLKELWIVDDNNVANKGLGLTDAGLRHLCCLNNLQLLSLIGTRGSDDGVATLQKALPNCKITR
jgi:hypothetical protein